MMALDENKLASILIVDDDSISVLIIKTLLKKHFQVDSVSNGSDALNAVKNNQYVFILMDIDLGDDAMDGIATMKLIRKLKKCVGIKIFALSSYVEEDNNYLEQGFDKIFSKPVMKQEMIDVMQDQIQR